MGATSDERDGHAAGANAGDPAGATAGDAGGAPVPDGQAEGDAPAPAGAEAEVFELPREYPWFPLAFVGLGLVAWDVAVDGPSAAWVTARDVSFLVLLLAMASIVMGMLWIRRLPRRVRLDADGIADSNVQLRWCQFRRLGKGWFRGSKVYLLGDGDRTGTLRLPPAEVVFRQVLPRVCERRPGLVIGPRARRGLEQPLAYAGTEWWPVAALIVSAVEVAVWPWVASWPVAERWCGWIVLVPLLLYTLGTPAQGTADHPATVIAVGCVLLVVFLGGHRAAELAGPRLYAAGGLSCVLGGVLFLTAVFPAWVRRLPLWGKLAVLAALVVVPLAVYWISTMVP